MTLPQLEFDFLGGAPPAAMETPRVAHAEPRAAFRRVEKQAPAVETARPAAELLHAALEARSGLRITLRITNNRSTLMSVKYGAGGKTAQVGLHHMFLKADAALADALAHWVKHPRSRKHAAALNGFMRANNDLIAPRRTRVLKAETRGAVYDLRALFDEVNAAHFSGRVDAAITWGKMPKLTRRRSIRFGSYSPQEHLIRMHPLLDDLSIPAFFVRYIVFHEMLHADLGIEEREGRRVIHSREFRRREQAYPDFKAAEAWLAKPANLAALLGRGRANGKR